MVPSPRYRINSPPITHQTVDSEVIIIDLESGAYYSLRGSGALIWSLLEDEADRATICAEMSRSFRHPVAEIEGSVEVFLEQLVAKRLIAAVTGPGDASRGATGDRLRVPPEGDYRAPELESYTDLQDLLLLDPIHQVGPQGWPRRS